MTERTVRIATRGSQLALTQAQWVADRLSELGQPVELVIVTTRGDVDQRPFSSMEGQGFFTKAVQDELLAGRADLAVHSYKDLPSAGPAGLTIAAVPGRANPLEVLLIAPTGFDGSAEPLPVRAGGRVGTSASRRRRQLAAARPDLQLLDLRGNVPTRVEKLRQGEYDAIIVAAAGLERLELSTKGLLHRELPPEVLMPAPAQGALALEVRSDDNHLRELLQQLHSPEDGELVAAERGLMALLDGGCQLALGAHATRVDGRLQLSAWYEGQGVTVESDSAEQAARLAFEALGEPDPATPAASVEESPK